MSRIDKSVAKQRLLTFQKNAEKIKISYRKSLFNKKSLVLFENKLRNEKNKFFGKDEYLNSVIVNSDIDLKGKIKLTEINDGNHITLNGNIDKKNKEDFAA